MSAPATRRLRAALEALEASTDPEARLAADPLGFVHRYDHAADQEVAAVFAAGLAYGRVAGFRPTIQAILDHADLRGGPRAWLRSLDARDDAALARLNHRWTRGTDLARMAHALAQVLDERGRLGAIAEAADDPSAPTLAPALEAVVQARDRNLREGGGQREREPLPRAGATGAEPAREALQRVHDDRRARPEGWTEL